MKIVHIITSLGIGGAEKLLVNVANRQAEIHQVSVIYFKVDTLVDNFNSKVNVFHIPLGKNIVNRIVEKLEIIQPNVVHTHLTHADLFGLRAAKKLKGAKTFTTIHNTKYRHNFLDYGYYALYVLLFNIISPKTKVIAISKLLEKQIHQILKVPKRRIELLYNTISEESDISDDVLPKSIIASKEKFKILFVGRLTKQKAVHNLIQSIDLLPEEIKQKVVVFIVGEGELRSELEVEVANLNLQDQIYFEGASDIVPVYYKNSDIFVLPSIFEGLPLVLLEAFRYKIPVVASNIEGPNELIYHNENGLLFEKNNPVDLAGNIELLFNDSKKRVALKDKSYSKFEEQFSPEMYIKKLEKIYQK